MDASLVYHGHHRLFTTMARPMPASTDATRATGTAREPTEQHWQTMTAESVIKESVMVMRRGVGIASPTSMPKTTRMAASTAGSVASTECSIAR